MDDEFHFGDVDAFQEDPDVRHQLEIPGLQPGEHRLSRVVADLAVQVLDPYTGRVKPLAHRDRVPHRRREEDPSPPLARRAGAVHWSPVLVVAVVDVREAQVVLNDLPGEFTLRQRLAQLFAVVVRSAERQSRKIRFQRRREDVRRIEVFLTEKLGVGRNLEKLFVALAEWLVVETDRRSGQADDDGVRVALEDEPLDGLCHPVRFVEEDEDLSGRGKDGQVSCGKGRDRGNLYRCSGIGPIVVGADDADVADALASELGDALIE